MNTTRFPELGYRQDTRGNWRFVETDGEHSVGPTYPTKTEMLADLGRFAMVYGCSEARGEKKEGDEMNVPRDHADYENISSRALNALDESYQLFVARERLRQWLEGRIDTVRVEDIKSLEVASGRMRWEVKP